MNVVDLALKGLKAGAWATLMNLVNGETVC